MKELKNQRVKSIFSFSIANALKTFLTWYVYGFHRNAASAAVKVVVGSRSEQHAS